MAVEQEIKLAYPSPEAARQAIAAAGGRLVHPRRLIEDRLFDDAEDRLRRAGTALRVRQDAARAFLTWKGPVAGDGAIKAREELETAVGDAHVLVTVLRALGYRERFRSQKYREEYALAGAVVTVDETPCGVFAEIEGDSSAIAAVAAALGRGPSEYILASYPSLWFEWCHARGHVPGDMLFT